MTRTMFVVLGAAAAFASCAPRSHDRPVPQASMASATSALSTAVRVDAPAFDVPALDDPAPRDYPGLRNVVAFAARIYSGGMPEDDAGFDSIVSLGAVTVISVDGAAPDLDRLRARGLRSIHLPIGYHGFDDQRRAELARATRDALARGPLYIHCHHGKHRSAAAAASVAASLGLAKPEAMVARMRVAGTSHSYTGLYRCAAESGPLDAVTLEAVPAEFPEVSRPTDLVAAMIDAQHALDHLKMIERAGWAVPPHHPDLVPAAEAGRLADVMRLLGEGEPARGRAPAFVAGLRDSAAEAQALEDLLVAPAVDRASASARLKRLAASCTDCHATHRD